MCHIRYVTGEDRVQTVQAAQRLTHFCWNAHEIPWTIYPRQVPYKKSVHPILACDIGNVDEHHIRCAAS